MRSNRSTFLFCQGQYGLMNVSTAEIGDRLLERGRASVGERVVRDHAFDLVDAVLGEVGASPGQESGRGGAFLVGVDLGVGEPGVVIDRGVDVVKTDPSTADLFAAAVGRPASTVRDPAEFLRIDMHQLTAVAAALLKPFADVRGLTTKPPPDARRFRESREEVARLCWDRTVVIHQIKGHSADRRNRPADKLATAARRQDASPAFWSCAWKEAVRGIEMNVAGGSGRGAICTCGPLLGDSTWAPAASLEPAGTI